MGGNSSTPSQNPSDQNPSQPTTPTSTMSSSISISPNSQNPDPKTLQNQNPDPKTLENQDSETSNQPINQNEKGQINQEERENAEKEREEEEGECGFCLFMKGGGCKEAFIAWEQCVEEAEKSKEDVVDKCYEITRNLQKCMEAHPDYYEPILRAEKAADDEVKRELDSESEKKNDVGSEGIEERAEIEVANQG